MVLGIDDASGQCAWVFGFGSGCKELMGGSCVHDFCKWMVQVDGLHEWLQRVDNELFKIKSTVSM